MDKVKYLVPKDLTVSQLATIVRNRLSLCQTDSLFLFSSCGDMLQLSMPVQELHALQTDQDGFLYITYASQEAFGQSLTPARVTGCSQLSVGAAAVDK